MADVVAPVAVGILKYYKPVMHYVHVPERGWSVLSRMPASKVAPTDP